jgi:hypothetical protein
MARKQKFADSLKLILEYEQKHWADESKISKSKVKESDLAEKLIRA